MSKLWAIPDIHGRFDLLVKLWEELNKEFNWTEDKVIYLGDMIDRGPESMQVVQFIKKQQQDHPNNVVVLLGNHEDFMIQAKREYYSYDDIWIWEVNGGDKTLASYRKFYQDEEIVRDKMREDAEWFKSLPWSHEEPGFFFSHAPAPSEGRRAGHLKGREYTRHELIWSYSRDHKGLAKVFKDKIGICGHITQPNKQPTFYDHYYFCDAGSGKSDFYPLVAVEVKTKRVVSVSMYDPLDNKPKV